MFVQSIEFDIYTSSLHKFCKAGFVARFNIPAPVVVARVS